MAGTNPSRKYDSSRRKSQAQQTRQLIAASARKLFIERGYSGTTIEAIASRSGVATETIYAIFGNKVSILQHIVEISVTGDDLPIPLLARPEIKQVEVTQDPLRQTQLFAGQIASIMERTAPLFIVMNAAAQSEPEIKDLLANILHQRLMGMRHFITVLSAHTALRTGLDQVRAAETVWALTSAEVFTLLTKERDWSVNEYAAWLEDILNEVLLR